MLVNGRQYRTVSTVALINDGELHWEYAESYIPLNNTLLSRKIIKSAWHTNSTYRTLVRIPAL